MYEIRFVYDEYVERNEIENAQEWTIPTIDEWRLETGTKMTAERMLVIAKARWVFHCERARCDHKQRRTLKIDRLIDRLREEMKMTKRPVKGKPENSKNQQEQQKGERNLAEEQPAAVE